jgi:hypothetical protein
MSLNAWARKIPEQGESGRQPPDLPPRLLWREKPRVWRRGGAEQRINDLQASGVTP